MMTEACVAVVVINWKLKEETLSCLRSVQQLEHACQMIVVDNGSGDCSAEYLAHHVPQAKLLVLPTNLGFAAACNHAIATALQNTNCEYVLLLNNDAMIERRAVSELLRAAQAHPTVGILGPKVYCRDQPDRLWYAGARRRRRVLAAAGTGRGELDRGQYDTLREVDYVFGAAMLVRRGVFEQIGLFDEQFFLYLEDMDFCLRAQASGFTLLFVPQAHVWHAGSASTKNNQALRKYHKVKSTMRFLKKYASPASSLPIFAFWCLVALRDIFSDLIRGDTSVIRSYWQGLIDGLEQVYDL
jgi:GT2 family glycosyltransferase